MHQPAALGRITALGVSLSRSEIERPGGRLTGSASRWRPVTDYGKSSMRPLRVFTQPGSINAHSSSSMIGVPIPLVPVVQMAKVNLWSPPFLQHRFCCVDGLLKSIRRRYEEQSSRLDENRAWRSW
jgi:hypothetical protein